MGVRALTGEGGFMGGLNTPAGLKGIVTSLWVRLFYQGCLADAADPEPMTRHRQPAIAHVRPDGNDWVLHDLAKHLLSVEAKAGQFAATFDAAAWAGVAGRWHDLGKYRPAFQHHIRRVSGYDPEAHIEGSGKVDHSTPGAIHAVEHLGIPGRVLAYLIAGHHAGLPDWEKLEDGTGGALRERLQRRALLEETLQACPPENLLAAEQPEFKVPGGSAGFALWVRMLFSCLVDADFLDTEAFMDGDAARLRGEYPSLDMLRRAFDAHMATLTKNAPDTPVNRLRAHILRHCRNKADHPPGFFSLTVPTGGGKTLSSMAFALDHAIAHHKRRIIHVIPYTSIIEQTADIFRGIFGEAIVEHHSSLDPERETPRSRLAAENWDAPIIVTTAVQFFESLFAARPGRCRKLHNIVNSVVVLDEAQLLPPAFLQPILDTLRLLVEHYGVTVVLSTATQPALNTRKDSFGKTRLRGLEPVEEIMPDPDALYAALDRVAVNLPADWNRPRDWDELAAEIAAQESVLAIVNTRRHARELHRRMPPDCFHLSASMCGQHRSDVIAEIRHRLSNGTPTRVVSTQLVEAGVDLDFPVVYRALAGLDSIAQAAGRCNREGRRDKGRVVVFIPPEPPPPGVLRRAAAKTVTVLHDNTTSPLARANFTRFFELFYADCDLDAKDIDDLLVRGVNEDPRDPLRVQFRTAAMRFRLIDEQGAQVLVRHYRNAEDRDIDILLGRLRKEGPSRWLLRKLQRYSVSVSEWHFGQLQASGQIEELWPGIWAQMEGATLYDPVLGLMTDGDAPPASDLVI